MQNSVNMVPSSLSMELCSEEEEQLMAAVRQINVAALRMSRRYCVVLLTHIDTRAHIRTTEAVYIYYTEHWSCVNATFWER